GCFPKTQERTNGCTMVFDHTAIPIICKEFFRGNAELTCDMPCYGGRDILFLRRKASFILEIFEHDGEAGQVVIGFGVAHQVEFSEVKRKVGFQFVIGPLSFHINPFSYTYVVSQAHGWIVASARVQVKKRSQLYPAVLDFRKWIAKKVVSGAFIGVE